MMQMAKQEAPDAAEIVAAECVTLAETKDHLNWELIGMLGEKTRGEKGKALKEAYAEVEDQEDEHFYHTKGWTRELWVRLSRLARGATAARGREERQDSDWRGPRGAVARQDALAPHAEHPVRRTPAGFVLRAALRKKGRSPCVRDRPNATRMCRTREELSGGTT